MSSTVRSALGTIGSGLRDLLAVRWVRRLAIVLAVLLVARAGFEFMLARALNSLAAPRHLVLDWRHLEVSMFSGRGELRFVELRPRTEADGQDAPAAPLLQFDYAVFQLELLPLLFGDLRVRRAEVDGLDAYVERDSEGTWNLARHVQLAELLALLEQTQEEALGPFDLEPPVAIEALRMQDARLHLTDADGVRIVVELDAALSGLHTSEQPARLSATLTAPGILDGAHMRGEVDWTIQGLRINLRGQMGGLRTASLAPWLAELDLLPSARELGGSFTVALELEVIGEQQDALRMDVALSDAQLSADGAEAFALDAMNIAIESISSAGTRVGEVRLTGARGQASADSDGGLHIAGLELGYEGAKVPGQALSNSIVSAIELWSSEALPRWATLLVRADPEAYPWTLGRFVIEDGAIAFRDDRVSPTANFLIGIEQIEIGAVSHDPSVEASAIPVEVQLSAPGLAESIHLHGEFDPFAPSRALDLSLDLSGIGMSAIEGYLSSAGLENTMASGNLTVHLAGAATTETTGRTTGWIKFDRMALEEGDDLLRLGSISARDLVFDPAAWSMGVGDVEIEGLHLAFERDASNRIVALGLRTLGLAPTEAPAELRAAATASGQPLPPLRVEVGRFAWTNSEVAFTDTLTDPPRRIALEQLGFELTNLTLGGRPSDPVPEPAHFVAHAEAPEVFEQLHLEGSIHSRPGTLDLTGNLELRCTGMEGALLAPYARVLGIEPVIANGQLSADLVASLREDDGLSSNVHLTNGLFADDGGVIAQVAELALEDLRIGEQISVGSVSIDDALLALARDSEGRLVAGGVRLLDAPDALGAEAGPAPPTGLAWPELPALVVHEVSVSNARITWADETLEPPIETELSVDARTRGLSTTGTRGTFTALLRVPDTLELLKLTGSVELSSGGLQVAASAVGRGLAPGPITRLLPAGVALEEGAGQAFAATLDLGAGPIPSGGVRLRLEASDFALDSTGSEPALAFERAVLAVPRIDLAGGSIEVGPLALEGLTLHAERDLEGRLHAAGLVLSSPPPVVPGTAAGEDTEATDPARAPRGDLPRVELVDDLSLELRRLTFVDALLGPTARPLETSARLEIPSPVVLVDPAPLDLPPVAWTLEGSIAGLIERWRVEAETAPFAAEPWIKAAFRAQGLRTAGLVELAPELLPHTTGVVEEGELSCDLAATLFVRRARATDLGLSRPFGAELELSGLALREASGGRTLIGLDHVLAEFKRIDLAQGLVHADLLELRRPHGVLSRDGNHVRLLGLEVDVMALAEQTGTEEAPEPAPAPTESAFAGEVRLDTLLVTGLDLRLADEGVSPPLEIALTELDAEVKQLTTKALDEARPVQFSVLLGTGPGGVFDEVALAGRVAPFPTPSGWVTLSLAGLELPPFSGIAAEQGLDIENGALDASVRVRLQGAKGAHVSSSIVFTDLALYETPGGPVESTLGLPMTLDVALFILRNANGEHRFSVGFDADADGISRSQLALAGTQAFAGVLARALAAAPLRLLGGLIPTSEAPEAPAVVYAIAFEPAHGELTGLPEALLAARRRLASDPDWVAVVRHELSAADRVRAERLANPTDSECKQLAQRLLQRKAELLRQREVSATSARTLFAVGAPEAQDEAQNLRALTLELAHTEDGLDRVLEILRSDSPRQRDKRTRATCREIAQRRLDVIEQALLRPAGARSAENLELRSPRFEVVEDLSQTAGGRIVIELRRR